MNFSNLVKLDVSSLILVIPKKKYHKRLIHNNKIQITESENLYLPFVDD